MLRCHELLSGQSLKDVQLADALRKESSGSFWIDLVSPAHDLVTQIEHRLGVDIPTADEVARAGPTSRLYREDGRLFMTVTGVACADSDKPERSPITFILSKDHLITLRYQDFVAFRSVYSNLSTRSLEAKSTNAILLLLLNEMSDRFSDLLETLSAKLDRVSQQVFAKRRQLEEQLADIGRIGDLTSKIRDGLLSIQRLLAFYSEENQSMNFNADGPHLKRLMSDTKALLDQASFLISNINFILDGTLGLISIEQNKTIKIFSVVAVIFLPPTLIASIYGMNFQRIPELTFEWGYPLALVAMLASAVLPYWFFRRRGWL